MLYYTAAVLLYYTAAVLLYYTAAVLMYYTAAVLMYYTAAALLYYITAVLCAVLHGSLITARPPKELSPGSVVTLLRLYLGHYSAGQCSERWLGHRDYRGGIAPL